MALFTDGPASGIEQLQAYESSIVDVSSTEGIDLDAKLNLANDVLGRSILRFLRRHSAPGMPCGVPQLNQVVVVPSLTHWHALCCLTLIYADAFGAQQNDRYAAKANQYLALAKTAERECYLEGIALVANPVRKAAKPVIGATTETGAPTYVSVALVNSSGVEGAPSEPVLATLAAGSSVSTDPDDSESSWNVYVGPAQERLTLQNVRPITPGNSWIFNGIVASGGRRPGKGQQSDFVVIETNRVVRG